jgi:hypothetical protein
MLITPIMPVSEGDVRAEVALVVGGSNEVMEEFEAARALCGPAPYMTFVCNDMIAVFPRPIDHAVTPHPDKMLIWVQKRLQAGLPSIGRTWAHRGYSGFTDHTKDWGGSSGLLCTKIAREQGFTHIILCGVPMTVENGHFKRQMRWTAAHGFRRGWSRYIPGLKPFVRSMSGWTQQNFGAPDQAWLDSIIDDPRPIRGQAVGIKA